MTPPRSSHTYILSDHDPLTTDILSDRDPLTTDILSDRHPLTTVILSRPGRNPFHLFLKITTRGNLYQPEDTMGEPTTRPRWQRDKGVPSGYTVGSAPTSPKGTGRERSRGCQSSGNDKQKKCLGDTSQRTRNTDKNHRTMTPGTQEI
jgi:hypothetical protein